MRMKYQLNKCLDYLWCEIGEEPKASVFKVDHVKKSERHCKAIRIKDLIMHNIQI